MGLDLCVVDCVRDCILFALPPPIEWQRPGKQIEAAFIFARTDLVYVDGKHSV
jgi:hypothetical protein